MTARFVFAVTFVVGWCYGISPPMASQPYDVIVVGMGAAGATAASTLAQAGRRRVLALDAQAHVGGRVRTVPFADGVVELGAEWIHGTISSRVYDAAVANNVTVLSQDEDHLVFSSDGRTTDSQFVNDLVDFCLNIAYDEQPTTPEAIGTFVTKKLKDYLKEKRPEMLSNKEFVEQFLDFVNLMMNIQEASNDWTDVSTLSEFEDLEGDQDMSWHRIGYKTFFDILLNKYNNGNGLPTLEVQLNKEVTQVTWPQQPEQQVVVTCSDGSVYSAHAAIVTVSLGVLKERHSTLFSPKLSHEKAAAIDKISMGVVGKIILSWNEPWWPKNHSLFALMWTEADRAAVAKEDFWTTRIAEVSNPMGANNALTLWTSGNIAKLVEILPEDEVKNKSMSLLRKFMGGNTTIPEPIGMVRSTWFSNPFTRGSYSFDGVGAPPGLRAVLGAPLTDSAGQPRLLFAGEATNPTHFATVHGASETGYREAMRLLSAKI